MFNSFVKWGLWIAFAGQLIYTLGILLNYDNAWIHPEKIQTHQWFLSNGPALQWEDLARGIDTDRIECGMPRITRPLSNLLELINAKFRVWLWNFIPPHPSLSLTWIVNFTAVPILLYLFFKNLGCNGEIALGGTVFYMATIGFLGPLIMLFHPGKAMVNAAAVWCLYLASGIRKRLAQEGQMAPEKWRYLLLYASIFLSFFWDETGVFIYMMVLMLFGRRLLWQVKERWKVIGSFLSLPALYYLTIKFILPWIHWKVRGKNLSAFDYESFPTFKNFVTMNWVDFHTNLWWQFRDYLHFHLHIYRMKPPIFLLLIDMLYRLTLLTAFIALIWAAAHYLRNLKTEKNAQKFVSLILSCLGLIFIYVYFLTFQLSHHYRTWGAWWYTNLFSLVFVVMITFLLMFVSLNLKQVWSRPIMLGVFLVFTTYALIFSTYRNHIFKIENLTRDFTPGWIFRNKSNQYLFYDFSKSFQCHEKIRQYTINYWKAKKGSRATSLGDHLEDPIEDDKTQDCEMIENHRKYLRVEWP